MGRNQRPHRGKLLGATNYSSWMGGTAKKAIALSMDMQAAGIQKLACYVIFEAAKSYPEEATKTFFESDDYYFWAALAGIDIDGPDILSALEKNGGVYKSAARLFRDSLDDAYGGRCY